MVKDCDDLTALVERLEAFEDRVGVRFEAISARISYSYVFDDDYRISVHGEIHAASGTKLAGDVDVQALYYDNAGRLIEQSVQYFSADEFFGFDSFEFFESFAKGVRVSKIRLLPKKRN